MKKLMIAAAAVALGMCASAAPVYWNLAAGTAASFGGEKLTGQPVYFFVANTTDNVDANEAAVLSALRADPTSSVGGIEKTAKADGTVGSFQYSHDTWGTTTRMAFYAVTLTADADGNKYAYLSAMKSAKGTGSGGPSVTLALDGTGVYGINDSPLDSDGYIVAGWYMYEKAETPVIPEPTSAMLLLLGVAGLALKRKQA